MPNAWPLVTEQSRNQVERKAATMLGSSIHRYSPMTGYRDSLADDHSYYPAISMLMKRP